MINEIERICPEEGTFDNAYADIDAEIAGMGNSQSSE
jgi:hypothetical protein